MFISSIYNSPNWALASPFYIWRNQSLEKRRSQDPRPGLSYSFHYKTQSLYPNVSCVYMAVRRLILMTIQQNIPVGIVFQRSDFEAYTVIPMTNALSISECLLWELSAQPWAAQHNLLLHDVTCLTKIWWRYHDVKECNFFRPILCRFWFSVSGKGPRNLHFLLDCK